MQNRIVFCVLYHVFEFMSYVGQVNRGGLPSVLACCACGTLSLSLSPCAPTTPVLSTAYIFLLFRLDCAVLFSSGGVALKPPEMKHVAPRFAPSVSKGQGFVVDRKTTKRQENQARPSSA